MKLQIKPGLEIGYDCPTFIVAEVGSNWRTLDDCLSSIRIAKACGADAVKFQLYDHAALYGMTQKQWLMAGPGRNAFTHLLPEDTDMASRLPVGWLPKLHTECQRAGIEFMCTAFSPELIDAVDPYVSVHKVASAELTHIRMLERLREIGKPVFLSTGASGEQDIRLALEVLGPTPTVVMYCVAAYPAKEIDLGCLELLRGYTGRLVGYSDHSVDALVIPHAAVKQGACVIEKHVNFTDHQDTPDAPHSLNEREFQGMVAQIRGTRNAALGATREEWGMVLRHNRRLIATRDIEPGETFQEGVNFGIFRALEGEPSALSPWTIAYVNGQIACDKIAAGRGITPQAIKRGD